MSGGYDCLQLSKQDAVMMLAASAHLGSRNLDFQMEQYVYKRNNAGFHIINLRKTWEKLLLAARAIAAVKNPADVCAVSTHKYGQRAVLKFARATGATTFAGRFTPGTFTNQIQAVFKEPGLLVINDPRTDHQPINEAAYANIPVIAFVSTDCKLNFIDIAIPCNTNSPHAVGLMWWLLAREVQRIRGVISRDQPWDVMVDLFFCRETEDQAQAQAQAAQTAIRDAAAEAAAKATASQDIGGADWAGAGRAAEAGGAGLQWTGAVPPTKEEGVAEWGASTSADWAAGGQEW
jgi:small subunit ribosomal protein SAe